MDRNLIDLYEDGGRKLVKAIDGLTEADRVSFPVPGTWSINQLVAHLTDCDLVFSDRMKRVIAEEKPTLTGFDESKWVEGLHYQSQSAPDLVALFDLNRRVMTNVLRLLPPEAFARTGTHTDKGVQTVEDILRYAVNHLDHHLKFLYAKREALGKLMW
ncbi:DinB family protein [Humisphaera borealis]|nr:DinB family protein [Humisphaera borealis]